MKSSFPCVFGIAKGRWGIIRSENLKQSRKYHHTVFQYTVFRLTPKSNSLGGLGEIGQNMMALEYDDDIIVIDAGLLFPKRTCRALTLGIPDITYLVENRDRVRAILITHGHEDHIGALPFVLPELDVPVYASRLAHGLITVKLRERRLIRDARLNVVEPHAPFRIGCFRIEFFRVCHSIRTRWALR